MAIGPPELFPLPSPTGTPDSEYIQVFQERCSKTRTEPDVYMFVTQYLEVRYWITSLSPALVI